MSKRDLFVIIYCTIWGIIGVIGTTIAWTFGVSTEFVIAFNAIFLSVTALWVFVPCIRNFVEKKIVDKLP